MSIRMVEMDRVASSNSIGFSDIANPEIPVSNSDFQTPRRAIASKWMSAIIAPVSAVLLSLIADLPSANAATYSASSTGTTCGSYSDFGSSTNGDAILTGGSAMTAGCGVSSFARVGAGFISTEASGDIDIVAQGGAFANATITEQITLTVPLGANPFDPIPVQVVFSVDALLFANAPTNDFGAGTALSRHRFKYSMSGFNSGGGGSTSGDFRWEALDDINNGDGNSLNVAPGLIVSNTIFIRPTTLNLSFGVETNFQGKVQSFEPGINGFADASNTASLATSGPAIILPEGYFANSIDLGIVDNIWIDPRVVPVPAALPLLLSALGLLGFLRRKPAV